MCAEVTLKPWPLTRTVATSGERGPLLPLLLYTMPCRPVGRNIVGEDDEKPGRGKMLSSCPSKQQVECEQNANKYLTSQHHDERVRHERLHVLLPPAEERDMLDILQLPALHSRQLHPPSISAPPRQSSPHGPTYICARRGSSGHLRSLSSNVSSMQPAAR